MTEGKLTSKQVQILEFLKENPQAFCMDEKGTKLFVLAPDGESLSCYMGPNFKGMYYDELKEWVRDFEKDRII